MKEKDKKELLNRIRSSAEEIEIPDAVTPERVAERLRRINFPKPRRFFSYRAVSAAAVLALCFLLSGTAYFASRTQKLPDEADLPAAVPGEAAAQEKEDPSVIQEKKRNAGDLYKVAGSYEEVAGALKSCRDASVYARGIEEAVPEDFAIANTDGTVMQKTSSLSDRGADGAEQDYSETNLQTDGVDESDRIKCDGRYIYTVKNQKVLITDTSDGLKPAGEVRPDMDPSDSVLELYADNGTLVIAVQHYESSADEMPMEEGTTYLEEDSGFLYPVDGAKTYAFRAKGSATLFIYDVSDPARPVQKGSVTQEGFYETSRKIGDILYLFTTKSGMSDKDGDILPCINGKEIPYDHVYLSERGNEGLIASSVDIRHPDEIIDEIMILHNYVTIYVGNEAIYLYHSEYKKEDSFTSVAKFQIDNGKMNAAGAATVKGEIYDSFAICEYQDTLRILTTSPGADGSSNHLYLLDEGLQLTGSLDDIAKGEQIYAARYFENTAYFVTYRNTDPLFAADLSDPARPVLLGQLEITGFSEYLHFWEDGKLLGIGYETDPDGGETKGIKLVMFDISDPVHLTAADSLVLGEYYYSPALFQYKCALADPQKNVIGFTAERNPGTDGYRTDYHVYAWEDGHFVQKLCESLPENLSSDDVRGLYIGDIFYVASTAEIAAYDMTGQYKETSRLRLDD